MGLELNPHQVLRRRLWRGATRAVLRGNLKEELPALVNTAIGSLLDKGLEVQDPARAAEGLVRCALGLVPEPEEKESFAEAAEAALENSALAGPPIVAVPGACRSCRDVECAAELACITGAIKKGPGNTVRIDNGRCLNCGLCIGACRAAAISDRAEVVQVARLLLDGKRPVVAVVAPSFAGQFGPDVFGEEVAMALRQFGFAAVVEVALGADVITIKEAEEYIRRMEQGDPFMITSCCCPPFIRLVQKFRPRLAHLISDSVSPMIAIGRLVKAEHPSTRVIFIGPCIAKKSEARQPELTDAVDYVLTFEEAAAMLEAGGIQVPRRANAPPLRDASHDGRIYGHTGGVTDAIIRSIRKLRPDIPVFARQGNGIKECRDLLNKAEAGQLKATFLEGMACPGGCVGGPGKLIPPEVGRREVDEFAAEAAVLEAISNEKARSLYTRHAPRVVLTSLKHPDPVEPPEA